MIFTVVLLTALAVVIPGLYREWQRQRAITRAERRLRSLAPLSNGRKKR